METHDPANSIERRPNVLERHVDGVLARRFERDPKFGRSFIGAASLMLGAPLDYKKLGVEQQARHEGASGTIDLLVRLLDKTSAESCRILIENKLDSSFTPSQPERYASSAVAMSRAGRPAFPIVCAPGGYIAKSKYLSAFKAAVSYEQIASWLDGEDEALVNAAILRFSMPYEPDPVPEVADFHAGYRRLVQELAPELVVKSNPNPGGERPDASRTIYFSTSKTLPHYDFLPALRFSHQCWDASAPSASVKIMFSGWAAHEAALRKGSSSALGNTGFYLRKAGRSLGLAKDTPRMNNKLPINSQFDAVVGGIRAAAGLSAWMHANESILRDWASIVKQDRGHA
jgi:hypothetical protein